MLVSLAAIGVALTLSYKGCLKTVLACVAGGILQQSSEIWRRSRYERRKPLEINASSPLLLLPFLGHSSAAKTLIAHRDNSASYRRLKLFRTWKCLKKVNLGFKHTVDLGKKGERQFIGIYLLPVLLHTSCLSFTSHFLVRSMCFSIQYPSLIYPFCCFYSLVLQFVRMPDGFPVREESSHETGSRIQVTGSSQCQQGL